MDIGLGYIVINNFNDLSLRNDFGMFFENFYFLELLNNDHYSMNKINCWRTTNPTEIDFIITVESGTTAIEVKRNEKTIPKCLKTIKKYYADMRTELGLKDDYKENSVC